MASFESELDSRKRGIRKVYSGKARERVPLCVGEVSKVGYLAYLRTNSRLERPAALPSSTYDRPSVASPKASKRPSNCSFSGDQTPQSGSLSTFE